MVCGGLGMSALSVSAEVTLPHLFSDNMVLQSDCPIPVWGWAAPEETVTVTLAGQTRFTKAGADRRWQVVLPYLRKEGPLELTVKGSSGSTHAFKNVLLGEVWLCSGQSNMDMPIGNLNIRDQEARAADYPNIRQFLVERVLAKTPQTNCNGRWVACSPKTVWEFSAASYYFGADFTRSSRRRWD